MRKGFYGPAQATTTAMTAEQRRSNILRVIKNSQLQKAVHLPKVSIITHDSKILIAEVECLTGYFLSCCWMLFLSMSFGLCYTPPHPQSILTQLWCFHLRTWCINNNKIPIRTDIWLWLSSVCITFFFFSFSSRIVKSSVYQLYRIKFNLTHVVHMYKLSWRMFHFSDHLTTLKRCSANIETVLS